MLNTTLKNGISVILVSENNDYILQAIESIVLQENLTIDIQIILTHTCEIKSLNKIQSLCERNNKISLEVVSMIGRSVASAKNEALRRVINKYVTFLSSDDKLSENALSLAYNSLDSQQDKIDFIAYAIKYGNAKHILNQNRFAISRIINLKETPLFFQYDLKGTVWKAECFDGYNFKEELPYNMDNHFVMTYLTTNTNYGVVKGAYYLTRYPMIDQFSSIACASHKEWYMDCITSYFLPLMKDIKSKLKIIPVYLQLAFYYDFQFRFAANINNANKQAIEGDEISIFFKLTKEVLSYIDDEVLLNRRESKMYVLGKTFVLNLLRIKYENEKLALDEIQSANNVFGSFNGVYVTNMNSTLIHVNRVDFNNKILTMHFEITSAFEQDRYQIYMRNQKSSIQATQTEVYGTVKCFGKSFFQRHTYKIEVPIADSKAHTKLSFFAKFNDVEVPLRFKFDRTHTKLTTKGSQNYWYKDGFILQANQKIITIRKATKLQHFKQELKLWRELLFNQGKLGKLAFALRICYWITRPYFKNKTIWLSFDKKYKGGDNGEYFFRYASKQKDGISMYYQINKSSLDYKRLKKEKLKLVGTKTFKLYLVLLNADIVFATHSNVISHVEFPGIAENFFRGLFHFQTVCIQHGLTVQQIPHTANKNFDNTKYYYCASKYEIQNLSQPEYGYDGPELKLTGVPRYDGLINNDKKQILITPTWRMSIASKAQSKKVRPYNPYFKESTYFKAYNDLINNKKLIAKAKEKGYKLIYLIHPTFTSQKKDFKSNDMVEILTIDMDISYEELLTQSSLMVTDYSGVQFDFAYMRKPIVYSHYKDIPPYYEEGGFNYKTMAFGEICINGETLVNTICDYMDHGCQMKGEFKQRVDDFFEYSDTNNCKRIYEESLKHQEQINKLKKK